MTAITALDRSTRVFRAAYPHFSRLSTAHLASLRARYPQTCHNLLKLALKLTNEELGAKLLDRYRHASPDDRLLDFPSLKELLIVETKTLPPHEQPEILSITPPTSALSKEAAEGLLQIFEDMVENLINHSHLTTEMLLTENMADKALNVALALHQPVEQGKAVLTLINYRIKKGQIASAASLYPHVASLREKQQAAAQLVDAWLHQGMVEAAVTFSGEIEDPLERNHALQEAALCMAKLGQLDEAIAIIECFEDTDIKAYALSRLVNCLAAAMDFKNAVSIAFAIHEINYLHDAFSYIIKKLISLRRIEEAIEVASLIPDMHARLASARLIERVMATYQQDAKVYRTWFKNWIWADAKALAI